MTAATPPAAATPMARNIRLYPWFRFCQSLIFWQAAWFLYVQDTLSAGEAVAVYAVFELSTTLLEVPSGYASDRLGRRPTLILSGLCGALSAAMQVGAETFVVFALAQVPLGAMAALASGTDGAMLYESLAAEGRADEAERQEVRAWRFAFAGLALSALVGGVVARWDMAAMYAMTGAAFATSGAIAWTMREPPGRPPDAPGVRAARGGRRAARAPPGGLWLFALMGLAYVMSHVGFVYAQPYIALALAGVGASGEAPLVAGGVVAAMMAVSLVASLAVPVLRARLSLGAVLLGAFAVQVAIVGALAAATSVALIAVLLLRMLPSSILGPLAVARVQAELPDAIRATFFSVQSLVARLAFAGLLALGARIAGDAAQMTEPALRISLAAYGALGLVALVLLAATAGRARLDGTGRGA
ncbi:MAG: MFS transporter [Shimia sp.]